MDEFLRDISQNLALRIIIPVAVMVVITLLAVLLRHILFGWLKKLAARSQTESDDMVLRSTGIATLLWCFFPGIIAALHVAVVPESWEGPVQTVAPLLLMLVGIYTGVVVLRVLVDIYIAEVASKTPSPIDDLIMNALKWIIPVIGLLSAVVLALDMLDIETVNQNFVFPVVEWLRGPGRWVAILGLTGLALVLLATAVIPRIIERSVQKSRDDQSDEEIKKRADTLSAVLVTSLQGLILSVVAFMTLDKLGLNVSAIIAGAGVVGIALGLGAQSVVRDIISGLFILLENQYRNGDVVRIADTSGLVEDVNLRRTILRDLDGIVHSVPNGEIKVASNLTKGWSRVNLNIRVSYGTDLDRAITVINRVGQELADDPAWSDQILKAPRVLRVDNFGEAGIEIKTLGDTRPIKQWDVTGELRLRLKRAFDRENIEIPWPHMKVVFGREAEGPPLPGPEKKP